jgi:hypothetical protein
VLGLAVTGEWFDAGFENVVEDARWEAISRPHTFVQDWADPAHAAWTEAPASPCATRADAPDRVLLVVANWDYSSVEEWIDALNRATTTLIGKYPGVKRVELLTMVRAPGNVSYGDPKSVVLPFVDEAIARVSAKRPELLRAGPKFEVPSCELFTKGGPHFTPEGGAAAAKLLGEHYRGDP